MSFEEGDLGDLASSFVEVLSRAGASGENVSRPTTGLQNGHQQSGVSAGTNFFFSFFSERAGSRYTPRHVFSQTFQDLTA